MTAYAQLAEMLAVACLGTTSIRNALELLKTGNQALILTGPPGTGKTRAAQALATQLCDGNSISFMDVVGNSINNAIGGYQHTIQFHPAYSYEDFVGGIRPDVVAGSLRYVRVPGIFMRFCDAARAYGSTKPFVFIIDEINRADLSAVFGELLSYLEKDYRNKKISIPHWDNFSIPANVYLIGTMNSLDKSLVTFDFALRRRFPFYKMVPNLDAIREVITVANVDAFIMRCKNLNEAIVDKNDGGLGLSNDHQIGQAYFMNIADFFPHSVQENYQITQIELEKLWEYFIGPLLEEYLGGDSEQDDFKQVVNDLKKNFTMNLPQTNA